MLFIFSTKELIRNLWQFKKVVFLHWCLIRAVPLYPKSDASNCGINFMDVMTIVMIIACFKVQFNPSFQFVLLVFASPLTRHSSWESNI
jgi:hypothetical protein